MEMESGKVFVGGISWETNEEGLREYFQSYGEVVEAVIMKDRTTGRARGFGFVVFLDPAVAQRVVKEKHMIDGRTVEAKKAVPRDDQQSVNRSNGSIQGSPGPTRTKKIFVGGLASTVTENDFKNYFEQFGTITDVVVMYDHNTQRPRGFGFITFDSDESVDKVLLTTFHELNGKTVEVKRAVPKESSPGPNRGQISGFNYGLSRVNSFLNAYGGRFSPIAIGRNGYPPFSPSVGPSYDSVLGTNYGGNGSFSINGYGRVAPNRYAMEGASFMESTSRNLWGNGSQNFSNNSSNLSNVLAHGNGIDNLGIWGNSNSSQGGIGNFNYGNGENGFLYGRNSIARDDGDIGGRLFYADSTWRSLSSELEGHDRLFDYGFGNGASDGMPKKSVGYVGYSVANRSNRRIAA